MTYQQDDVKVLASKQELATVDREEGKAGGQKNVVGEKDDGWKSTLTWVGVILSWYMLCQSVLLPFFMKTDPNARAELLSNVPIRAYEYSEAAFFTAMILNLLSFVFEETASKRQLAVLSAVIKGLSWHCDTLIVGGTGIIKYDAHGAILMPSRYVQWSCTTPTMLFTLSKISNFSFEEVVMTIVADITMVFTGWIAAEVPFGFWFFVFAGLSFSTFYVVLYMMHRMIASARSEATENEHAKSCLTFTWDSSLIIWHLFPTGWTLMRMGVPFLAVWGEPLMLFSNFAAKVVFSSCILYNNFVTIAQRRLIAQLEEEHKERVRMVAELKEAVQSKDEFISVVGHELRTPLNAIIQLSNAMTRGAGGNMNDRTKSWMDTISNSATHLLGIINDIISVKANRSLTVKQELLKVAPIVDNVMKVLAPMVKPGVIMEKIMAECIPPMVGDERRLMQALSNIIGNAIKFTDKGSVSVRVYPSENGDKIMIKVVDTGCGIPKDKMTNLFKPFQQADMSSKRKFGGTGLGLSIAKQLVEAHQGTISAESDVTTGTTIIMTFPVLQRETRSSLEMSFKEAYSKAGFSITELVSTAGPKAPHFVPDAQLAGAKKTKNSSGSNVVRTSSSTRTESSRSPQSSTTMASSLPSNRGSADSVWPSHRGSIDMATATVEHYKWEDFGGFDEDEEAPQR